MNPKIRRFAIVAGTACALLAVFAGVALYTLQTNWFRNKVRERIVSAVENVSGGRVEIGSFDYDWHTLTADFRDFVVRGKEPESVQPLFHADGIRVGLKILSVLERNIDVASIVVTRPRFHLIVGADGSTNIPLPRLRPLSLGQGIRALVDLKVRHFEFIDGLFEADLRRIPFSVRGENTFLSLAYVARARRYDVKLSSGELHVNTERLRSFSGTLEAKASLERDRLSLHNTVFKSGASAIQTSGTLEHFAHPVIDLQLAAEVEASDFAAIANIDGIGRGHLTLKGAGHYDETTAVGFQGRLVGRDVAYRIKSLDLRKVSFEADVIARPQDVELTRILAAVLGSTFSGHMAFQHGRDLQVDGLLAGVKLRQVAALFSKPDLPWSGVARGPVHLRAELNKSLRDVTVQSELAITPEDRGIPLSGGIGVTYRANGPWLEFSKSTLSTPYSHLSFDGIWGATLNLSLDSTNLDDLTPAFEFLGKGRAGMMPTLLSDGKSHFDGKITGPLSSPEITGALELTKFRTKDQIWDQFRSRFVASASGIQFSGLVLDQGHLHATADGSLGLLSWLSSENSPFQLHGQFRGLDLSKLARPLAAVRLQSLDGTGSGTLDLQGTLMQPSGTARVNVANMDAYGERLNQLQVGVTFAGNTLQITRGHLQGGPAELSFSGGYQHAATSWREGQLQIKVDSNGFPLASLAPLHQYAPGLNAQFEVHGEGTARITADQVEPLSADGTAALRNVTVNNVPYGSMSFNAGTRERSLTTSFSGNLRGSRVTGSAQVQLKQGTMATGDVSLDEIKLSTIASLIRPHGPDLPFEGVLQGGLTFDGPLQRPDKMQGTISIEKLQLSSSLPTPSNPETGPTNLMFGNTNPVVLRYADGVATVSRFQMKGRGSEVTVSGSIPLVQQRSVQLNVNGSVDLGLFKLFDPNVQASGQSLIAASIGGNLMNPTVNGTLELKNGRFFGNNLPNGLTAVNGTVRFDRDRATIERLTAQTGGGELSLGGFITFGTGGPVIYRLEANADNVRVRYGGNVSITATSQLRLTGTSANSILSGTATVSRVIFNPNTDLGNLLTSAAAPTASPSNEKDFLTGLQFDVHVESAPNLQLSTELSRDVEAEIDLRLRGTPERPVLLGSITANQGDIRAFGAKYTINRGDVTFVNAVKIEPVLDLDLQTQARGVSIDITISGTPGKLNINYRSDPPLQPRDIIALLTVGRAPNVTSNVPNASVTNDASALQSGANTVLGQAISPASNRLSKLFGITNIKIDPMVQGITNTPQARLTVEQQISRQITVTYITNLSQTSEQIFRLEWAFSTQYSLVALRDDNGEFGIDIQYRKRFK